MRGPGRTQRRAGPSVPARSRREHGDSAFVTARLDGPFVFHAEAGVTYTLTVSALNCTGAPGGNYLNVSAKSLATAGQTPQLNATLYFGDRKAYEIRSNATADELITVTTGQSCQYDVVVIPSTEQGRGREVVLVHERQLAPRAPADRGG